MIASGTFELGPLLSREIGTPGPSVAAYTAGVVEARGWLGITRARSGRHTPAHYTAHAAVVSSDGQLVTWLASTWGGRVFQRAAGSWTWRATGDDLRWLLGGVGPQLRVKGPLAACLRQLLDLQDGTNRRRSPDRVAAEHNLYERARRLNRGAAS